jgi:hypothetical protein
MSPLGPGLVGFIPSPGGEGQGEGGLYQRSSNISRPFAISKISNAQISNLRFPIRPFRPFGPFSPFVASVPFHPSSFALLRVPSRFQISNAQIELFDSMHSLRVPHLDHAI